MIFVYSSSNTYTYFRFFFFFSRLAIISIHITISYNDNNYFICPFLHKQITRQEITKLISMYKLICMPHNYKRYNEYNNVFYIEHSTK